MSALANLSRHEDGLRLEGALDFDSVPALLREGERLISGPGSLVVDLGGVREANTAALALLLEWVDLARRRKLALRFRNLPASLVRLAELSNVSGLLKMSGDRG
jgi:phospholipid transport system transporter-binding protein